MYSRLTLTSLLAGCLALGACSGDGDAGPGTPDITAPGDTGGDDPQDATDPDTAPGTPDTMEADAPGPDATADAATEETQSETDADEPDPTPDVVVEPETSADAAVLEPDAGPATVCGDGVCEPGEGCESCVEDCPVCGPGLGDLLITEIMQNPGAVTDAEGEWLEIKNIGSQDVELSGVVLRDDGQDHHVITPMTSLVLAPGAYAVLGASEDLGVGVTADYMWSGFLLGNAADTVVLEVDGVVIDAVVYDGGPDFPDPNGASMKLDPSSMSPTDNDAGQSWCASTTAYGAGDFGSPGADNPACTTCGNGSCEDGEVCETCPDDCGSCTPCDQGAAPTDETCNGVDDDCDGTLDEATCDDGVDCTEDWCDGESGCDSEPYDHACLIGGECYQEDGKNPANDCEVCEPGVVNDAWATVAVSLPGSCDDGTGCTEGGLCVFGLCVGSDIQDGHEPNDTQAEATGLGQIDDGADFPADTVTATLFGEGDVDWYTFFDEDDFGTQFHPRVELDGIPAGSEYRLCLYMVCEDGTLPDINSCEGGVEWSGDEEMAGCCTTGSQDLFLELSVGCSFGGLGNESGDIYIEVEHLNGTWGCDDYTLAWGDE